MDTENNKIKTSRNKKKIWIKIVSNVLFVFFALIVIYLVINIFFPRKVIKIFKRETFVILTDSMEPVLNVGDMVIIKATDPSKLQKGDIIAFYVDANNDGKMDVVTHYFERIDIINGDEVYRTTSEASRSQLDSWYLQEDNIIGKYKYHIPKIGKVVFYLRSPIGIITILIDFAIIYLIISILEDIKKEFKQGLFKTKELSDGKKISDDEVKII